MSTIALPRSHPRWRLGRWRWPAAVAGSCALLGGLYLGFARSPFASVGEVRVEGLSGPQAGLIAAALRAAGRGQSTLEIDEGALRAAVRSFPQVRSLRAEGVFPHLLLVKLTMRLPVGVLAATGGARSAVAADGALLGPALAAPTLPQLSVPTLYGSITRREPLRSELALLGAAPRPLLAYVASVGEGAKGLMVTLKNGLALYFGSAEAARQKWGALVAVLSGADLAGARYIDLREPRRPAVGSGTPSAPQPAGSEQEQLIANLKRALYGGPSAAPQAAAEPAPEAGAAPSGEGTGQGVPQSGSEAAPAPSQEGGGAEQPSPSG